MKLTVQLPALVLDLPEHLFQDHDQYKRVAKEFRSWLKRFLVTWGWRKFAKHKYPAFENEALLSMDEQERDAESWVQLKPSNGEQLSDLLRHVASSDQEAVASHDLKDCVAAFLRFTKAQGLTQKQALKKFKACLTDVSHFGHAWDEEGNLVGSNSTQNEIVLVLGDRDQGVAICTLTQETKKDVFVKLLRGNLAERNVDPAKVVRVNDTAFINYSYLFHDTALNQTMPSSHHLKATISAIDPAKGVLITGKDPEGKPFRSWINNLASISNK